MSATLKWKPVKSEGKSLHDSTKFLLRAQFGLNDGPIQLDESCRQWMQGAIAATNEDDLRKDLTTLVEAIGKYGQVELWLEY